MSNGAMRGVIKKLVSEKMYGFIRADGAGGEFFFHASGLQATSKQFVELVEGDRVEFTPIDGQKGPRALEVRAI